MPSSILTGVYAGLSLALGVSPAHMDFIIPLHQNAFHHCRGDYQQKNKHYYNQQKMVLYFIKKV